MPYSYHYLGRRVIASSLLAVAIVSSAHPQGLAAGPDIPWHIRVSTESRAHLYTHEGRQLRTAVLDPKGGVLSPDGTLRLLQPVDADGSMNLVVEDVADGTPRVIAKAIAYEPAHWLPSLRILFLRARQLHVATTDGQVEQLTSSPTVIESARVSRSGRIVYSSPARGSTPRAAISHMSVLEETRSGRVLARDVRLDDFDVSPDGDMVAAVGGGYLTFIDVATGKASVTQLSSVDRRFGEQHGARSLRWRPDGKAIGFLVVNHSSMAAGAPLPWGNREYCLVDMSGRGAVFHLEIPEPVTRADWTQDASR